MGLLDGLKVLDLSRLLPGPYASLLLADLGADVVKVEDPEGGDYLRWMPPVVREESALFHALNRNKRSLALNLKVPEGAQALLRLVASGWDVVLESFRPGVLDRLGIGWDALREANPRVILCSVTGYGQDGPMAARAGHDLNYVGLAGILGVTGEADGAPVVPGVQVADLGGGAWPAAVGLLAAVHRRARTGEGAWLDISMTEGALGFMSAHLAAAAATGRHAERGREPLNGAYPCYRPYRTRDGGYMALAALEPQFWTRFCLAVGREDLVSEGWTTGEAGARVQRQVEGVFAARTRDEWVEALREVDCCCEPVRETAEVFGDPQFVARGAFVTVEDPREGRLTQVATPVRVRGEGPRPARPAPGLGAHTAEVLSGAGFDDAARRALAEAGAVPRDD